jgi:hypothetical protein
MKKIILTVSFVFLFSSMALAGSNTFEGYPVVNVKVNDQLVQSDVPGVLLKGTTMVPLRVVSETLGAEISWDSETKTANIKKEDPYLKLMKAAEKIHNQVIAHNATEVYFAFNGWRPYLHISITFKGAGDEADFENLGVVFAMVVGSPAEQLLIDVYEAGEVIGIIHAERESVELAVNDKISVEDFYSSLSVSGTKLTNMIYSE